MARDLPPPLVLLFSVVLLLGLSSVAYAGRSTCEGQRSTITGTPRGDVIRGTPGRDVINALAGNDRITGLGGNDLICGSGSRDIVIGGAGADRLYGGSGHDSLKGGGGNDRLVGFDGDDALDGGIGSDQLSGGGGTDEASARTSPYPIEINLEASYSKDRSLETDDRDELSSIEDVTGSKFGDKIWGDDRSNRILGLDGADEMFGATAPMRSTREWATTWQSPREATTP